MALLTTNETTPSLHDNIDELSWAEYNLTVLLFITGNPAQLIAQLDIEQLLDSITASFNYGEEYPVASIMKRDYSISAPAAFLRRQSQFLFINARRYWRTYTVSKQKAF